MFGISAGFESKVAWRSPRFPLRSFIKSMAENVLWRLGGGGRGGGGGGGGREPEGGGGGGGAPGAAAGRKQRKEHLIPLCSPLTPPRGTYVLLQRKTNTTRGRITRKVPTGESECFFFHFVTIRVHLNTYVGDSEGQVGDFSFFFYATLNTKTQTWWCQHHVMCVVSG